LVHVHELRADRFDGPDRSVVISNLIGLARGADVLVHEALYLPRVDRLVSVVPNATDLRRSILSHRTPVEDARRVAEEAGVKTLVLSHLIPADDPAITDKMWIEGAQVHFRGRVIVGKDLMET
jgi:ribonuclease BN (tRNA processing enzyme)